MKTNILSINLYGVLFMFTFSTKNLYKIIFISGHRNLFNNFKPTIQNQKRIDFIDKLFLTIFGIYCKEWEIIRKREPSANQQE